MTVFCYKKLDTQAVRLNDRMREARELLGWDISQAAKAAHIPPRYLEALETGKFCSLPKAKAYRLAYVKQYAVALGLSADRMVEQFSCEEGLENTEIVHPRKTLRWFPFASISIFLRNIVLVSCVMLFAGYMTWQVHGILVPPTLQIYSPTEGSVFNQPVAMIQGATDKEANLTINGVTVVVDSQGHFSQQINLTDGVNTITVAAAQKHGKTTTIVRHLVVDAAKVSLAK